MMLRSFKARAQLQRKAGEIYGAVVTQARQPDFYLKLAIPDTPQGRYEIVVIHLFLVLERLRGAPHAGELQRVLIETFVADMDASLRELGTGDLSVGRKVQRAAAGFYARSGDYRAGLAESGEQALEQALTKHVGAEATVNIQAAVLARYIRLAAAKLEEQSADVILAGVVAFPAPGAIAEEAP